MSRVTDMRYLALCRQQERDEWDAVRVERDRMEGY